MKKKPAKKSSPRKKTPSSSLYFKYVSISFLALVVAFSGKLLLTSLHSTHVLGASIYLAEGGDEGGSSGGGGDSNGGGDSGSRNSGSSGGSSGGGSQSGLGTHNSGSGTDATSQTPNNSVTAPISDSTTVDCVGPDGKHFTTSFHDCQELNQKWGHTNFNFTLLGTTQNTQETPQGKSEVEKPEVKQPIGNLEVQKDGNKGEFNLESAGTQVEIKQEDNGLLKITAHKADGTEIELKTEDALSKLNEALAQKDLEVSTDSANGFTIKKGEIEAETHFPLSVNTITGELTVTIPAGAKAVTILPDEVVNNLLTKGVLSSIQSTATSDATVTSQQVNLTQLNNQLAFEVNGVSNKKVLGVLPVAFAKKVFVSAETGSVLQTQETLLSRILEALSF